MNNDMIGKSPEGY